jgi:hypothetical protein
MKTTAGVAFFATEVKALDICAGEQTQAPSLSFLEESAGAPKRVWKEQVRATSANKEDFDRNIEKLLRKLDSNLLLVKKTGHYSFLYESMTL